MDWGVSIRLGFFAYHRNAAVLYAKRRCRCLWRYFQQCRFINRMCLLSCSKKAEDVFMRNRVEVIESVSLGSIFYIKFCNYKIINSLRGLLHLFKFYKTSTLPLPNLYWISISYLYKLNYCKPTMEHRPAWCSHLGNKQFPPWEQNIPTLGTKHSHTGNETFPHWE